MNKSSLRWVIVLMSIALVGLIAFQLYWIGNLTRANEDRFKKDVIEALHQVSKKLEKYNTYNYLRRQASQNQLVSGINSFRQQGFFLGFSDSLGNGEFSLSFNIGQYENKTYPTGEEKKDHEPKNEENVLINIFEEMLQSQPFFNIRLDNKSLDSLIRYELEAKGIDIEFDFGVYSPRQNRFVYLDKPTELNTLKKSGLEASLCPNDITGEYNQILINFPKKTRFIMGKVWLTAGSSALMVLVILFCFGYALLTIIKQKKLSEMKSDFINNMTHELKTPIATVGLAVEALQDEDLRSKMHYQDRYLKIIDDENKRLATHVEKVLHMAAIERRDVQMKKEKADIHQIIRDAVSKISLQIENRKGLIKSILNAEDCLVFGDPTHLMNVVLNLLDNANKYSPDAPNVVIRTESNKSSITISIQDRGVGLTKEASKNIFQKFYRVSTGNLHNVKGFGLGLAYVRSVVDEHDGKINVESQLGKGTKFYISLPIKQENAKC